MTDFVKREGDPLSPLSFVVVMESLCRMLLSGFSVVSRDNEELILPHHYLLIILILWGFPGTYTSFSLAIPMFQSCLKIENKLGKVRISMAGVVDQNVAVWHASLSVGFHLYT